ncbi:MAG: rhomboid family intramembrane serine protease [Acidobacteriota bacterium]
MGIGTRNYARPYAMGGGLPYGIKLLLIANVAIFLLQYFGANAFLLEYFALRPVSLFTMLAVWQLATYMFLHGGIGHILFNMLALWMFGRELEETWGTQRFLRFYFFCGIGAGICIVLANYILPNGNPGVPTIGASGAIYGILLASAMLWPDRIIYFNFLFPIKMKYFVMIYGAIAFLGSTNMNSGVSDIGHLGGLLCAWIFMKTPTVRGFDPAFAIRQQYQAWKLARNKRKFKVYLKKKSSDRDPWVN